MKNKIICVFFVFINMISCSKCWAELRDPTRPPANIEGQKGVSASSFALNAIILSAQHKIAIINGSYKQIGDEILGERIVDMDSSTVQLIGPNGKMTLFLYGEPFKSFITESCITENKTCM